MELVSLPGVASLPPIPVDPAFYVKRRILLNGGAGVLSQPRAGSGVGSGPIRVEWIDRFGYHLVLWDGVSLTRHAAFVDAGTVLEVARRVATIGGGEAQEAAAGSMGANRQSRCGASDFG